MVTRLPDEEALSLVQKGLSEAVNESSQYHGESNRVDGLLINGDNRLALDMLKIRFERMVRCIYIDPPYNTGNRDFVYHDAYDREHWLEMMLGLLNRARDHLSDDGSIFVSIDDSELARLRLLMDEVFGESNFVSCIAYERSGSAGLGQSGVMLNTKEYILFYSFNRSRLNVVGNERALDYEVMKRYCKVLLEPGERKLEKELTAKADGGLVRLFRHDGARIETISLRDFAKRSDEIASQYAHNYESIFRTQNVQKENTFQNSLIKGMDKKTLYSVDYTPSRGKYKGTETTLYYYNAELCAWLKDSSSLDAERVVKWNKLTDMWVHGDIPKADLANEGGVYFPRGKKPEHLLHRILSIATNPGDLVLDFFLGSGTTAAVAHKMGRKWIGVEHADFFDSCTLERLRRVVGGDATGISKKVNWKGGGRFQIARL